MSSIEDRPSRHLLEPKEDHTDSTSKSPEGTLHDEQHKTEALVWVGGWRLVAIATGTCIALGITQADSTIASTAIITITNDLGGFDKSSWVFTAYLLTYSGFPIILARLSDIFGRKNVLIVCIILFTIFSGAAGASQTLLQLIMFRWVQGIGASGILSIGTFYGFELRPPEKWPAYSALISLAMAISLAVSPVIGASLTEAGQWRWIFLINAPIGVLATVLLIFGMPTTLMKEPLANDTDKQPWYSSLKKLDFVGVFALLGASILLTGALQQAANGAPFSTASVLALLVLATIFFCGFLYWQWLTTHRPKFTAEPILSWDILTNRVFVGIMMNGFFSGVILTTLIVQIPQRFILVNNLSTIQAGVRLLPFAAVMTGTTLMLSVLLPKLRLPIIHCLLVGMVLQVAGVAGFSQSSTLREIHPSQYGFQILVGCGLGIVTPATILATPYVVDKRHLAVASGALGQIRVLGGSIGLSIVICASSPSLRASLRTVLSENETDLLLSRTETILSFSEDIQDRIRPLFGRSYNLQMLILIGFTAANLPAILLQWKRKLLWLNPEGTLS